MKTVKVLIADDSVVYRSQIRAALASFKWIEVVGAVSNGRLAIEKLGQMAVDLLILDLEMPEMSGLETLTEIAKRGIQVKTLVFSSASKRGAEITFDALRLGAKDFVTKPGGTSEIAIDQLSSNPSEKIKLILEPKITAFFPEATLEPQVHAPKVVQAPAHYPRVLWEMFRPKIIVIGSSTGGPTQLEKIFTALGSGSFELGVPIVITQHMPPLFTASLAERITRMSGFRVKEGEQGEVIEAGTIYLAPGGYHLSLEGTEARATIKIDQGPLINSVRPAVDPLFNTAAKIFKERTLGIVLTGMGSDGKDGAHAIKSIGGGIAIQEKESCVVFGMPGAVHDIGAFDKMLTPDEIVQLLKDKAVRNAFSKPNLGERKNA